MVILVKYYDNNGDYLEYDGHLDNISLFTLYYDYNVNINLKEKVENNTKVVNTIEKLLKLDDYNNIYSIIIEDENITDEELDLLTLYPNKLKHFICIRNKITKIPNLPESVNFINCRNNNITEISILPKNIEVINCSNNKLNKIPNLPENVKVIICSNNNITEINPEKLPKKLIKLNCSFNQIKSIPNIKNEFLRVIDINRNELNIIDNLPKNLKILSCNSNKITNIKDLPETLEILICNENYITKLPFNLPKKLEYLDCCNNNIRDINNLLNTKLKYLYCSNNPLSYISIIPETTEMFVSSNTKLEKIKIPEVNNIKYIDINHNYYMYDAKNLLKCKKLEFIDLYSTKINKYYYNILNNYKSYLQYNKITYKTYKYSQQFWN